MTPIVSNNITNFFEDLLTDLECQRDTKAYIVSIYGKFRSADFDLSKDSVTLLFAQARNKHDFLSYQKIGDWLFFSNTMAPAHLHDASIDYYQTIARLSYYSCYNLINKQWRLFEELSDNLPRLESQVKNKLKSISL